MPSVPDAPRIPSYRHRKPSGQAVVTLNGRDFYLGKWNTNASRAEYDRLIGEWLAAGRSPTDPSAELTVAEVARDYWRYSKTRYRKRGQPTSTLQGIRQALRPLRRLYGTTAADKFGPKALKALRLGMLDSGCWSRTTINKRVAIIKRMFKWAVAEEMVPPAVHQALSAVEGLREGSTAAREPEPIGPVADAGAVTSTSGPHLPLCCSETCGPRRTASTAATPSTTACYRPARTRTAPSTGG